MGGRTLGDDIEDRALGQMGIPTGSAINHLGLEQYNRGNSGSSGGNYSGGGSRGSPFRLEGLIGVMIVVGTGIGITRYGLSISDVAWYWPTGIGFGVALLTSALLFGPFYFILTGIKWGIYIFLGLYGLVQYREAKVEYGATGWVNVINASLADAIHNDLPYVKAIFGDSGPTQDTNALAPSEVVVCRVSNNIGMQRPDAAIDRDIETHYENSVRYAVERFSNSYDSWRIRADGEYRAQSGKFGFPVVMMMPRPGSGSTSVQYVSSADEQVCPNTFTEYHRFSMPAIGAAQIQEPETVERPEGTCRPAGNGLFECL